MVLPSIPYVLRPYQDKIVCDCRAAFASGRNAPLVVLFMGGGKTKTAIEMVRGAIARGLRVLWLAHREELCKQAAEDAEKAGLEYSFIGAGLPARPSCTSLQICMIQTLIARGLRPAADLVICDEAHHASADEYLPVILHYPKRVGLTATPARSDGRALGYAFDSLVLGPPVTELISGGYVLPCRVLAPPQPLPPGEIAQNPVEAYKEHCNGLKTIVFAANIKAATLYHQQYLDAGIRAAIVTSHSSYDARSRTVLDLRDGDIDVLVNVFVFTEGFNEPSVGAIILARGFQSPGPYLQASGRAMRPFPGKSSALIVDLKGVTHVHGAPDSAREYSLDGIGIRNAGSDPYKFCQTCHQPLPEGSTRCPNCQAEVPEPPGAPDEIGVKLEPYAGKRRETDGEKITTLARYILQGRIKGYKPGWSFAKFSAVYGHSPNHDIVRQAKERIGNSS